MRDDTNRYIGFGGSESGYSSSKDPHNMDFGLIEDTDNLSKIDFIPGIAGGNMAPNKKKKDDQSNDLGRNLFALYDQITGGEDDEKEDVPKPVEKPKHHFNKDVVLENRLLHIIGDAESGNNYNIFVGGKEKPLTKMTIKKVRDMQQEYVDRDENSASGKYQIKASTMDYLIKRMKLTGNEIFDEKTQDRMARELLKRRGIEAYKRGEHSDKEFISFLANEWAAIPKDETNKSRHSGVGNNKALIKFEIMKKVLKD